MTHVISEIAFDFLFVVVYGQVLAQLSLCLPDLRAHCELFIVHLRYCIRERIKIEFYVF